MRISNRLAVAIVLSATVAASTATVTYFATAMAMNDAYAQYKKLLTSELDSRRLRVQHYLTQVSNDLSITANSRFTQHALVEFTDAFHQLGDNARDILQKSYIEDNPNPPGRKHLLMMAKDGSEYSNTHFEYHKWIDDIANMRNYYDIFLVDTDGHIVYTVFKEDDFATNLSSGKYSQTELASIYDKVVEDPVAKKIYTEDFVPYAPSNGKPAAFMGTAVNYDGNFVGVVIIQLKSDPFNEIMRYSSLLGESGETLLVGSDHLLRSRSRFAADEGILKTAVDTPSVENALAGRSGIGMIDDYRGIPVMSAYAPIVSKHMVWAIISKIDIDEVEKGPRKLMRWLMLVSAIASLLAFLAGWFLAGRDRPDEQL